MAKPPPDADPEKFILGKGTYSNQITYRAIHDETTFRIEPAPMPVASIIVHNVIFVAFFYGMYRLINAVDNRFADEAWKLYAPLGVGLLTCVVYTLATWYFAAQALRLGTWLIYDKRDGSVTLPREGERFARNEIVHVQYVTTKSLSWGGAINNDRRSELNLVTERDGDRRRWPLLRSIANVWAFDRFLKSVIAHTDLPIMRVEDEHWGWKITEKPFGRD
jgi:hypothetical protein